MVHITNNRPGHQSGERAVLRLFTALILCSVTASAQSTIRRANGNAVLSVRATHLLGFEDAKNNCKGTLSVRDASLQFHWNGKPGEQELKVSSVRDVVVGEESEQVGGLPMTLGKAAAPYGGGEVYDTLTLEYVDDGGAVHGTILQLQQGEAPEQVGFYNYHRWATDPREFVTNAVADRLRANGTFTEVKPYDGRADIDYVLSGRLEKLEEIDYDGGVKVEVAITARSAKMEYRSA